MREAYYRCLIEMDIAAVTAMHARPDLRKLKAMHFVKLLKGEPVPLLPCAPAIAGGAAAGAAGAGIAGAGVDEAGEDSDDDDDEVIEDGAAVAPMPDIEESPFKSYFVRAVEVKFDYCSHSSGVQRGYIRCGLHENCWRYAQINVHPSKRHLAAALFAWRTLGPVVTRAFHVSPDCQPDPALVAELLDEVVS